MENQMNLVTPEEVGFASQRLARIKAKMQRYVDEQKIAGISSLIARRGKVAHFAQVGLADSGRSPDCRWPINQERATATALPQMCWVIWWK